MLPKPGKSEYKSVRSYRPITLEITIGKVMERVVCKQLVWKLEVEGGVASAHYAYRKQKSCVQIMLRKWLFYLGIKKQKGIYSTDSNGL